MLNPLSNILRIQLRVLISYGTTTLHNPKVDFRAESLIERDEQVLLSALGYGEREESGHGRFGKVAIGVEEGGNGMRRLLQEWDGPLGYGVECEGADLFVRIQ